MALTVDPGRIGSQFHSFSWWPLSCIPFYGTINLVICRSISSEVLIWLSTDSRGLLSKTGKDALCYLCLVFKFLFVAISALVVISIDRLLVDDTVMPYDLFTLLWVDRMLCSVGWHWTYKRLVRRIFLHSNSLIVESIDFNLWIDCVITDSFLPQSGWLKYWVLIRRFFNVLGSRTFTIFSSCPWTLRILSRFNLDIILALLAFANWACVEKRFTSLFLHHFEFNLVFNSNFRYFSRAMQMLRWAWQRFVFLATHILKIFFLYLIVLLLKYCLLQRLLLLHGYDSFFVKGIWAAICSGKDLIVFIAGK